MEPYMNTDSSTNFPTMYSRDSTGNLLVWQITVKSHGIQTGAAMMIIQEGRFDGTLTPSSSSVLKGKNIGKINETTPMQQALLQAQSRIEKKTKQGYKTLDMLGLTGIANQLTNEALKPLLDNALPFYRTDANNLLKPMKAQPYFKDNGDVRINFPCWGQPKLNGFRCMGRLEIITLDKGTLLERTEEKVVFRSKEGLAYEILDHIQVQFTPEVFKAFGPINAKNPEYALDGEMYCEGMKLQDISSAVRKKNSNTPRIKFHIFDVAVEGVDQTERIRFLIHINTVLANHAVDNVVIVDSVHVPDNALAQALTDSWIKDGYEGGIFRSKSAMYQFGSRPQTMTKLKRFEDSEFVIIDVVSGDKAPELGVFVCVAENGNHFKVNPEGTAEKKKEYLSNKTAYIGKKLNVRFFERTKDGLPFHAVGKDIRDYE